MQEQMISLENLAQGALAEQFEQEVQRVLWNIADPNTSPLDKREINIKIVFRPNADRDFARVTASVGSKLAASSPVETSLLVDVRGSVASATELVREQTNFEFAKQEKR